MRNANDTLSQEEARTATDMMVQQPSAEMNVERIPQPSPVLAKGTKCPCVGKGCGAYREPSLSHGGEEGGHLDTLVCAPHCHHKRYLSGLLAAVSNGRKNRTRTLSCK